ncbi:MAG: GtrA family protein [Eubacteriales bacterium]|jgi:putative flippase GtrA
MKERILRLIELFDIRKFLKFGTIGVLNTLVDLAAYYVLQKGFGIDPYISQVGSFLIAALNSFLFNKFWTFEKRNPVTTKEAVRYLCTNAGYLLCSLCIMRLLIGGLQLDPFVAKFPTAAVMVLFNYLMAKFWVFSDK